MHVRVEAMLPEAIALDFGCIVEGVVGPVHEGVLAEHGSHLCGGRSAGRVAGRREDFQGLCGWICDANAGRWQKD